MAIVGWAEATESAHEAQGDRSMRAGRYGEAAAHYQRAVDQNAKSAALYRKLAEAHAKNEALPCRRSRVRAGHCPRTGPRQDAD